MQCTFFEPPAFLFFSSAAPELLYYSHFSAIIVALIVGVVVITNAPSRPANQILCLLTVAFSAWTVLNLYSWVGVHSDWLLFLWSLYRLIEASILVLAVYFAYLVTRQSVSNLAHLAIFILTLPVIVLTTTDLNISGFNLATCNAFDYEGKTLLIYNTILGIVAIGWVLAIFIHTYRKSVTEKKRELLLLGTGLVTFLIVFYGLVYLAELLTIFDFFGDSRLEFFGMFGMTFFMVLIGATIVQFRTFQVAMHITQMLVISLIILIGLQYTFASSLVSKVLTTITLLLVTVSGYLLVKSVRKEVQQRNEIEKLATNLEKANQRLRQLDTLKSEFVSIASHQLRSPLAAMMGYASMLRDGSYGKLPVKAQEAAVRIEDSTRLMAQSVEDYLNVSRIEAGHMKYNLTDFSLIEQAQHITDDIRPMGLKKGVVMLFRTNMQSKGMVNADKGKTEQIIHNLINNSLKYTPQGTITVIVRDSMEKKRIYLDILDTGIGMSENTVHSIFTKFERGSNANTANIHGTGLGLFTALKLAEAMGGTITARSEGEGKGSCFTFELPLVG